MDVNERVPAALTKEQWQYVIKCLWRGRCDKSTPILNALREQLESPAPVNQEKQ